MKRVIIDTNVFISAIGWGGLPFEILEQWKNNRFILITSLEIIEEIERIVEKLDLPKTSWQRLKKLIFEKAGFIEIKHRLNIKLHDPEDIKFIECAFWGGASHIVTGDKTFLKAEKYQNIDIVSPRKFLAIIKSV